MSAPCAAQITSLSSFNPTEIGSLCGAAYDSDDDVVWAYGCSLADLHAYAADGTFLGTVPRPGESANDVDIEIAPEALTLDDTAIPAGTLLFINGESGPAEIYAIDPVTGTILDTLNTAFGVSHVVGGAYSTLRNTFFLVQDRVPGATEGNRIAEVDPATGAVLNSFQIGSTFSVNFGDLEVSTETGNLFVVSSAEGRIAEYEPDGTFVDYHTLPSGVSGLSGIGLDCAVEEAWVSSTNGTIYQLGSVPCGAECPLSFNSATITPLTVSPGGSFTVSVNVANAGPGAQIARLTIDYARTGGGPSGTLTLGTGTVPVTTGVPASVSRGVPNNAPGGTYALDLNLVSSAKGVVCDTRPFTLTVQSPRLAGEGAPIEAPSATPDLFGAAAVGTDTPLAAHVFPNPVHTQASIRFTLDASSDVRLVVYDALGREATVLAEGSLAAGPHEVTFDPVTSALPNGVYLYRLVAGRQVSAGRLTVAR